MIEGSALELRAREGRGFEIPDVGIDRLKLRALEICALHLRLIEPCALELRAR